MSNELDRMRNAIATSEKDDGKSLPVPVTPTIPSGLFSFRYASTEIYSQDGNLHVKLKETRYQDGRLTSEECEGTVDRQVYDRMVSEAQGYFLNQMAGFVKLFFAPFSGRR